ncbi:MAG: hypothetical protein WBG42_09370 [Cryomorphaceae bacterium]
MKFRLTLVAFLISVLAYCQDLEGRWVNVSFSGEENLAYLFEEDNTMKLYYAGKEVETEKPIKYTVKKDGDFYLLEMKYTQKSNSLSSDLLGLVKFMGKNKMELEFFDKKNLPEKLEFSEESMTLTR